MKKKFLEVGKIVGTHGIRGELRVEPWCDTPEFLAGFKTLYYNEGAEKIKVKSRPHKHMVLMKIDGVDSIEAAELLRGRVLYIDRSSVKLPEGRNFIQDLIGCRVLDADSGADYGEIVDVFKTGANDVYAVRAKDGSEYLVPVIDGVVIEKNVDDGVVLVRPIKGLFDDED